MDVLAPWPTSDHCRHMEHESWLDGVCVCVRDWIKLKVSHWWLNLCEIAWMGGCIVVQCVKLSGRMPTVHVRVPGIKSCLFPIPLPAHLYLDRQQRMCHLHGGPRWSCSCYRPGGSEPRDRRWIPIYPWLLLSPFQIKMFFYNVLIIFFFKFKLKNRLHLEVLVSTLSICSGTCFSIFSDSSKFFFKWW